MRIEATSHQFYNNSTNTKKKQNSDHVEKCFRVFIKELVKRLLKSLRDSAGKITQPLL